MERSISVIIATRNRATTLVDSLNGILTQQFPSGYSCELIVVDNNSKDHTRSVIEKLIPPSGWIVKYLFEEKPGKSRCLNLAIEQSSGEILVFTDDDTYAETGWLAALLKCFEENSCDVVGGRVLPVYPKGIPPWVKKYARILDGPIVYYNHGSDTTPLQLPVMSKFIGANMAVRREMFERYGGFNVDLGPGMGTMGDDTEFINRLLQNNHKLFYCGQALIWHPVDPKRVNLRYFASWAQWAGGYYALKERPTIKDQGLPMLCGVPRYLWTRTFMLTLRTFFSFRRSEFLRGWLEFHRNVGMIKKHLEFSKLESRKKS